MSRIISKSDVKKHNRNNDLWFIIHNDVYDVTKFLSEHPGGEDTLLDNAGKDATEPFEDVGHSDDARELLKKYKIGTLPLEEQDTGNAEGCCPRVPIPAVSRERPLKCEVDSRSATKHSRSSGLGSRSATKHSRSSGLESRRRRPSVPKCEVCKAAPCICEAKSRVSPKNPCEESESESEYLGSVITDDTDYHYESIYVPLSRYRNEQLCSQCTSIESCPRVPKPEVSEESPWKCEADSRCSKKHSRSPAIESRGSSRISCQRSERSQLALTDETSDRVKTIYVPLETSTKRPRGDPCVAGGSNNWKWILLAALLSAVVVGVVLKRRA